MDEIIVHLLIHYVIVWLVQVQHTLGGSLTVVWNKTDGLYHVPYFTDCEGNQNFVDENGVEVKHSMVHEAEDVMAPVLDNEKGAIAYRAYKHGQRTGNSFKGAMIRVLYDDEWRLGELTGVDGNTASVKFAIDNSVEYIDFPDGLMDPNVEVVSLPDDGEVEHMEFMICLGNLSTLGYKAASVATFDSQFRLISIEYGCESTINRTAASKLFGRMQNCTALKHNGCASNQLEDGSPNKVPVFSDGELFYTMWDASPFPNIQNWIDQGTARGGIIDDVETGTFEMSGCPWAPPQLSNKKLLSSRVNVTRDLLMPSAQSSRCFDLTCRSAIGGADGFCFTSDNQKQTEITVIRETCATPPTQVNQIKAARDKINQLVEAEVIKIGQLVHSLASGHNDKKFKLKQLPFGCQEFWEAFPESSFARTKPSSRDYGLIMATLAGGVHLAQKQGLFVSDELLEFINSL